MKDVKLNLLAFAILMVVLAPALLAFIDISFILYYLYAALAVVAVVLFAWVKCELRDRF